MMRAARSDWPATRTSDPRVLFLERLNRFQRFLKRMIQLTVLGDAASQDRLEVREVGDVDDLIDALHKRAHGVVGGEAMAEEHDEMLAPVSARAFRSSRAGSDSSAESSL